MKKIGVLCLLLCALCSLVVNVQVSAADVRITPQWGNVVSSFSDSSPFNTNMYDTSIANLTNPLYRSRIKQLGSKFIRIHNAFLMDETETSPFSLVRIASNQTLEWNSDAVTLLADAIKQLRQDGYSPEIMFNIPSLPLYFNPFEDVAQYEAFMADIVYQLNVVHSLDIHYFEITNELDDDFDKGVGCTSYAYCAYSFTDFVSLYSRAALAMKSVDGTIKTGGLSFQNPFTRVDTFLQAAEPDTVDFISVHRYDGLGNPPKSVSDLLSRPKVLVKDLTQTIQSIRNQYRPQAEIFINEYNICYEYQCGFGANPNVSNIYMAGHTGAVFDALGFVYTLESGLDGLFTWNEKDAYYGKLSSQYDIRNAGYVHTLFNSFSIAMVAEHTTTQTSVDNGAIKSLTFKDAYGKKGVILINKTDQSKSIEVQDGVSMQFDTFGVHELSGGITHNTTYSSPINILLQPYEIQFVTWFTHACELHISAYLSGAYSVLYGTLKTDLHSHIPYASPYQSFVRRSYEDGAIVDWMYLEIKMPNRSYSYSTLLLDTGTVVSHDGLVLTMYNDCAGETADISISHRNHISQSMPSVNISAITDVNFSLLNTGQQLEVGVYGMFYGDLNSDGFIDSADRNALKNTPEQDGVYSNLDINLDGSVDALDRAMMRTQQEFGS